MERKELGRIKDVRFGHGGYQEALLGLSIALGGESWGTADFRGTWFGKRSESAKWTEEDRLRQWGEVVAWLDGLLTDAKQRALDDLVGTPIEATFDDAFRLKSWRILKEVL